MSIDILNRPPDKSAESKINFVIPQPKHILGAQKNGLNETFFEHLKHIFILMNIKKIRILRIKNSLI